MMSSDAEDGGATPLQDEPEYGFQLDESQPMQPGGTQPFLVGGGSHEDEEEEGEEGEIADEGEDEQEPRGGEDQNNQGLLYGGEDEGDQNSEGQLSGGEEEGEVNDEESQQEDEKPGPVEYEDDDGEIQDSDSDNDNFKANVDEPMQSPTGPAGDGSDGIQSPMAEEQEETDIRSPVGSEEGGEVRSPSPAESDQDDQGPASPVAEEESVGPASPDQDSVQSGSAAGENLTDNALEVYNQDSTQRSSDFDNGATTDNQNDYGYQNETSVWSETVENVDILQPVSNQQPYSTEISETPQSPSAQETWSSMDSNQGPQSPSGSSQGPKSPSNSSQGPKSPDDVGNEGAVLPGNQDPQSPSVQDEDSQASVDRDGPSSPSNSNQGPQSPGYRGDDAEGPASPVDRSLEGPASPVSDTGAENDDAGPRSPSNKDEESRDGSDIEMRKDEEAKIGSDDEEKRSDAGSDDEKGSPRQEQSVGQEETKAESGSEKGSDDEDSDKESNVGELIADIFGSSDEEEEFEGFQDADVETPKKKRLAVISDDEGENEAPAEGEGDAVAAIPPLSDDDEGVEDGDKGNFVSDFDLMLERKKEEMRKRRRKRKDFDIINDNDDLIAALINQMKTAAEEDRVLNNQNKPAIKKLRMLPEVLQQLRKSDLQGAFLDCGILPALTEWLAPLPDRSLPHLQIREGLLKILQGFPPISSEALKSSGLGKAVMYLYKHPKEIRENHERAGKLINDWSRPIFNLTSNYKNLSKEEREQRDYEQLPKKRRISSDGGKTPRRDIDKALAGDQKALRPGDKGWVQRARVPMPSNKDYVVRPRSSFDSDAPRKSSGKKDMSRLEKHMRNFQEKKKQNKSQRAVGISIEGRNMSL